MFTKLPWVFLIGLIGLSSAGADDERQLKIISSRSIPQIESITVYETKKGKREAVAKLSNFDKAVSLPHDGPFEIFAKPKGGIPIIVAENVTVKIGQSHQLKLGEMIGSVEVFGDNFPRAEKIVLTEERDPGPGEKGHVAIQTASDYRVDMAAPPGRYAVWIIPSNGAKAQRVVDRVRILAGKSERVGD